MLQQTLAPDANANARRETDGDGRAKAQYQNHSMSTSTYEQAGRYPRILLAHRGGDCYYGTAAASFQGCEGCYGCTGTLVPWCGLFAGTWRRR